MDAERQLTKVIRAPGSTATQTVRPLTTLSRIHLAKPSMKQRSGGVARALGPCAFETCAFDRGFEGVARLAAAFGANNVTVLVLGAASVEIAYRRTAAGDVLPPGDSIPCEFETRVALDSIQGPIPTGSSIARFLTSAIAPTSKSFILFPWRARPGAVTIAFGFEGAEPACVIPDHVVDSLNLAALATWSLKEVSRLRAELRAANQSFAARKAVERAKGVLQAERGMSEQQAYEYLRCMSRQRRVTISRLAEDLLGAAHWP